MSLGITSTAINLCFQSTIRSKTNKRSMVATRVFRRCSSTDVRRWPCTVNFYHLFIFVGPMYRRHYWFAAAGDSDRSQNYPIVTLTELSSRVRPDLFTSIVRRYKKGRRTGKRYHGESGKIATEPENITYIFTKECPSLLSFSIGLFAQFEVLYRGHPQRTFPRWEVQDSSQPDIVRQCGRHIIEIIDSWNW